MEEVMNVPEHVAIILDGNGRWAKEKGMPRNYGGSDVSEDEINDLNDELQKITDKFIKDIDTVIEDKNKEIMTV